MPQTVSINSANLGNLLYSTNTDYYPYTTTGGGSYQWTYNPPVTEVTKETIEKNKTKIEKENKLMNKFKKICGPVNRGLCRLAMDGNIAIKTIHGYKTYDPNTKAFTNCEDFVFDIGDEMFFIMPTNTVAEGDIIIVNEEPRYVLNSGDQITVINYTTGTVESIIPERSIFMGNTYLYGKIVSMFKDMGGENPTDNIMKYMMLSQMMKDGNEGFNPMMFMMLGGDFFNNIFGKKD